MALVTFAGCAGCGACLLTCPTHAIRPDPGAPGHLYAREDLCTACGECVEVCPVDAVHLSDGGPPLPVDAVYLSDEEDG